MIRRLLFLGLFFALVVPAEAVAAPPVLLSVGSVSGHATATWALPPGVLAEVVEVATSPSTGSDGYFFAENREAFDTLEETQTSWTDTYQTSPGTYYVHVLGLDNPCFYADRCPVREASNVMVLTIGTPQPSTPTQTLSIVKSGSGAGTITSNPAGIDCGTACSTSFRGGIHITLTATPAAGSVFAGWNNSCASSPVCEVTLNSALIASARFDLAPVATPAAPVVKPATPVQPLTPPTVRNKAPSVAVVRKAKVTSRIAVQTKICHNESGPLRAVITRIGVGSITRALFLEKGGCAWYQVKTNWKAARRLSVRVRDVDGAWSATKFVS